MLQERNQRCRNRSNLLGRYVHQFDFIRSNNRIVGILTGFYPVANESSVIVQRCIALSDNLFFFFLGCEVNQTFVRKVYLSVGHLAVGRLDETKLVDLGKHAK